MVRGLGGCEARQARPSSVCAASLRLTKLQKTLHHNHAPLHTPHPICSLLSTVWTCCYMAGESVSFFLHFPLLSATLRSGLGVSFVPLPHRYITGYCDLSYALHCEKRLRNTSPVFCRLAPILLTPRTLRLCLTSRQPNVQDSRLPSICPIDISSRSTFFDFLDSYCVAFGGI